VLFIGCAIRSIRGWDGDDAHTSQPHRSRLLRDRQHGAELCQYMLADHIPPFTIPYTVIGCSMQSAQFICLSAEWDVYSKWYATMLLGLKFNGQGHRVNKSILHIHRHSLDGVVVGVGRTTLAAVHETLWKSRVPMLSNVTCSTGSRSTSEFDGLSLVLYRSSIFLSLAEHLLATYIFILIATHPLLLLLLSPDILLYNWSCLLWLATGQFFHAVRHTIGATSLLALALSVSLINLLLSLRYSLPFLWSGASIFFFHPSIPTLLVIHRFFLFLRLFYNQLSGLVAR